MRPPNFDGIQESVTQMDGLTRRVQVLPCSAKGCDCKIEVPVNQSRKPPSVIFNIARRKGWSINENKRDYLCPQHKKETKMTTKEAVTRQPNREQRRAIFREIDDCYSGRAYVNGVTDKSIGEKLKLPWAWVAAIREENFGPAGLDPELQAAIKKVDDLDAKIKQMETDALAAFEGSVRQIADVAEELKKARAVLVRFAS